MAHQIGFNFYTRNITNAAYNYAIAVLVHTIAVQGCTLHELVIRHWFQKNNKKCNRCSIYLQTHRCVKM